MVFIDRSSRTVVGGDASLQGQRGAPGFASVEMAQALATSIAEEIAAAGRLRFGRDTVRRRRGWG